MALYFFDFREDGSVLPDTDGVEFPTEAMRTAAVTALSCVAQEYYQAGRLYPVSVEVRDQEGQHVFGATLTLSLSNANQPQADKLCY